MPAKTCPVPHGPAVKMVMPAGLIKRIHVNQGLVRHNVKNDSDIPAVTVQWRGKSYTAADVVVRGESRVMQRMNEPLSCGARIWIETKAEVELV